MMFNHSTVKADAIRAIDLSPDYCSSSCPLLSCNACMSMTFLPMRAAVENSFLDMQRRKGIYCKSHM